MSTEHMDQVQDVLDLKAVEAQLETNHTTLEAFIEKSNEEIKAVGTVSTETKSALDALAETVVTLGDEVAAQTQAQVKHFEGAPEVKSPGELLVECDEYKAFSANGGYGRAEIKTAIVNAVPSLTQPMTAGHRLDTVVHAPDRALRIRDLLLSGTTDSNIVWFPKENTWTSAAAVQVGTASPIIVAENVALGEAALTFTSDSEEVKTIGHFIPVSKQALADSNFLKSYTDQRLLYGLALKVDSELLVGTGTVGTIEGIYTGRTAYTMDSPLSYTTKLDVIRDAKAQLETTNYQASFCVLNPADWAAIELTKETAGMYVFSNPGSMIPQTIWGMRVVLSNTMVEGTFMVGSSDAAQVWTRETASVSISYEDSTNFQKEMATLKAVERLALTIYNSGGYVGGLFAVT